jgi:hypothetical protein
MVLTTQNHDCVQYKHAFVMMLRGANMHENWQNACDMANHDVAWFLYAMQNYLKLPVSVIITTSVNN